MGLCKISKGIGVNCNTILSAGTQDRLILISRQDFLDVVTNVNFVEGNVISDILIKVGQKGYAFDGINNSNVVRSSFARTAFFGNYVQEVDFIAFDMTPDTIATLQALNKDRVIAVFEDNNGWFRVAGLAAGLITSVNNYDTGDVDSGGAHRITLISDKEKGYPAFLSVYTGTAPNLVYDRAASKLVFDALLEVAA